MGQSVHVDVSWSKSYSFRSQLSSLISVYMQNMNNKEMKSDIEARLVTLLKSYESHIEKAQFMVRQKTWRDLYPKAVERVLARLGFFLFKKSVLTEFFWFHLLFGYKVWVRLDLSGLKTSDICMIAGMDTAGSPLIDKESLLLGMIEDGVKLRSVAVLDVPNDRVVCDAHCSLDTKEVLDLSVGLTINTAGVIDSRAFEESQRKR